MVLYVRVDWPESQKWEGNMECFLAPTGDFGEYIAFVPEELYERAELWNKISCLLNGGSRKVDLILPSVERESCGLSDLEKLNIDEVDQIAGEGTMWYHFEGTGDAWHDMSDLDTEDLRAIYEALKNNE